MLNGDPLDLILFRKTGWILDEVPENVDETASKGTDSFLKVFFKIIAFV